MNLLYANFPASERALSFVTVSSSQAASTEPCARGGSGTQAQGRRKAPVVEDALSCLVAGVDARRGYQSGWLAAECNRTADLAAEVREEASLRY